MVAFWRGTVVGVRWGGCLYVALWSCEGLQLMLGSATDEVGQNRGLRSVKADEKLVTPAVDASGTESSSDRGW